MPGLVDMPMPPSPSFSSNSYSRKRPGQAKGGGGAAKACCEPVSGGIALARRRWTTWRHSGSSWYGTGLYGHPEPGKEGIALPFQGLHRGFALRAGSRWPATRSSFAEAIRPGISLEVFAARTSCCRHDSGLPKVIQVMLGLY